MPDLRRLAAGAPSGNSSTLRTAATVIAVLTIVGLLPVLVIGASGAVVSTGTVAVAWLLYRRVTE